jgi:hypothetical protein
MMSSHSATSDLVTVLGILGFLAVLAWTIYLGGMRPSADYYDKAMPGQMDDDKA